MLISTEDLSRILNQPVKLCIVKEIRFLSIDEIRTAINAIVHRNTWRHNPESFFRFQLNLLNFLDEVFEICCIITTPNIVDQKNLDRTILNA